MKKSPLVYFLLIAIVLSGFLFRLKGIQDNHSFWHDEAFVAALARDFLTGKRNLTDSITLLSYQPLHLLITMGSMKIFGFSEFSARLPAVLVSTLGIVGVYLLARELSNKYSGLIAAFVYSFSQLNLANSTQGKPYSSIQALFVIILYLIALLIKKPRNSITLHVVIIFLASISSLLHYLGVLIWIPYLFYFVFKKKYVLQFFRKKPFLIFILVPIAFILFFLFSGPRLVNLIISDALSFPRNNLTYFRELFWKNYAFITLPSSVAILSVFFKKKNFGLALMILIGFYMFLWIFKHANHSIRYVVPVFGILFVFFGVFWGEVIVNLLKIKKNLVLFLILIILYAGGNKIVRKPAFYYSPNQDFFADIQVADYKKAFRLIRNKYPNLSTTAFFNDWIEAQMWYLPEKPVTAYFMKGDFSFHPKPNNVDGTMIYGNLGQFLREKSKYQKGLLFVEDWESILPEEIKQYAKKNMKREFRVEGLPQAQGDNWPIEVYSWGMN